MAAAAPGTVTQTLSGPDGTILTVTLHTDPATGDWADPAVTVGGNWLGSLGFNFAGGHADYTVTPGQEIARATLVAAGVPAPNADTHFGTTLALAT